MGFLGSTRGLTPSLDAFASGATVFTRAYAQAPITTVSHATILTGLFPPAHRVTDFGSPLPATAPYLPSVLHDQGYATAAFVGSLILDPRAGTAPGFDRGFDVYDAGYRQRRPGEDRYQTVERRGSEVTARALRWISAAAAPWFVWVHLYDAHDPYDPPPDLKRRFASAPYDGEIVGVDRLAGQLIRAAGNDAIVALTADHGEALGDHGEETHGMFLYDAELHVPLVLRLPGEGGGSRVTTRVRLADVAPTLLGAAGVNAPGAMQGQSLARLKPGAAAADRPVYAETEYPRRSFGWSPLVSWRNDRFLYIRAPKPELYDLVADPDATRNLAADRPRVVDGMQKELDEFMRTASGSTASAGAPAVDPELARRLAALGYFSGSGGSGSASGVDPKDRIGLANALHSAAMAVDDGEFQKAIPLLERVTASEPNVKLAQLELGVSRAHQKQYARALEPLNKAVALDPEDMFAHYELGVALYETGDLRTAAGHFELVASRLPKWADARFSYASVCARIDRVPDAVRELREALKLEPKHFRANLLLGRILTLQGQADEAIGYLRTAASVQPENVEARQFLDDALAKAKK